jgi:hypothetical protein
MRRVAIVVTALALVLIGGAALASIPDANGVIHACRLNSNGSIRVIDTASQSCNGSETELTWSQTGPQGPAGPSPSIYTKATSFSAPGTATTTFTQNCDVGDLGVGGGWRNGFTGVSVTADRPAQPNNNSNNGWSADFTNSNATARDVEVHAVCLDVA